MQKTVLITGNKGYIGPIMTKTFKEKGYKVVGLDSNYYKGCELFQPETLPDIQIDKDIRDIDESDLSDINVVVHLSALSNDPLGELNPSLTEEINTRASIKLAKLAKKAGAEKYIFSSSCSVYGIAEDDTSLTEESRVDPITAYAKAKLKVEQEVSKLADNSFHPVFMRNATVYGLSPMFRLDLVVNNLTAWAYFTGKVAIMSDGSPWRPIIHIADFCNAFVAVAETQNNVISNQIINVGQDKENYRVKEIAEYVKEIVPNSNVEILGKTGSDERSYKVNFSKIKQLLPGFKPKFDVKKGISELYQAYKKFHMDAKDLDSEKYFRVRWIKRMIEEKILDINLKRTKL